MNRKMNIAVVLAAAIILAGVAYTQAQVRRASRRGRRQGPSLTEALAKLELTQGKQRQAQRILSAQEGFKDEAAAEREKLLQEMEQARQLGDNERVGEIRADLWRRRRAGPAGRQEALERLKGILTEQQYAQLEEVLSGPTRAESVGRFLRELQSVGLNIRQEAAVDKIMAEATEKIRRYLTAEQREKLADALAKPESRFARRTNGARQRWQQLSDEQRETLAQMREQLWERLSQAQTAEQRRQIRQEIGAEMRELLQSWREEPEAEDASEPSAEEDADE